MAVDNNNKFEPYIKASQTIPEVTLKAIILGALLSVIFGVANAYLGLKVGMTVSASIPAAVISMALLRSLFKKVTVLENNIVQTVGSAGESFLLLSGSTQEDPHKGIAPRESQPRFPFDPWRLAPPGFENRD